MINLKTKKWLNSYVPEDWEVKALEQITLGKEGLRRGPFGGALKKEIFTPSGYPVYEQRNAIYQEMNDFRYFIPRAKFEDMEAFQLNGGDFIVSCSGTIGRIALIPNDAPKGVINQALLRIRLDTRFYARTFFYYVFSYQPFQSKITDSTQGGAMKNLIGMSEFRKTQIISPPLPEQQKIAEILSTVDAKIENIEEQIKETEQLKKGMMQRLLTQGIGHTEFKDSPLGRIPKSWEVKKLGDCLERIIGGGTPSKKNPQYWNGSIPWASVKDLTSYSLCKTKDMISELGLLNSSANLIPAKTVIIATRMAVGKAVVFNCPVSINQDLKALIPKTGFDNGFLHEVLKYNEEHLLSLGSGSTVKGIRLEVLRGLTVPYPPEKEQKTIANELGRVESKLGLLFDLSKRYRDLKQGLMQKLLTGQIRVKTANA